MVEMEVGCGSRIRTGWCSCSLNRFLQGWLLDCSELEEKCPAFASLPPFHHFLRLSEPSLLLVFLLLHCHPPFCDCCFTFPLLYYCEFPSQFTFPFLLTSNAFPARIFDSPLSPPLCPFLFSSSSSHPSPPPSSPVSMAIFLC